MTSQGRLGNQSFLAFSLFGGYYQHHVQCRSQCPGHCQLPDNKHQAGNRRFVQIRRIQLNRCYLPNHSGHPRPSFRLPATAMTGCLRPLNIQEKAKMEREKTTTMSSEEKHLPTQDLLDLREEICCPPWSLVPDAVKSGREKKHRGTFQPMSASMHPASLLLPRKLICLTAAFLLQKESNLQKKNSVPQYMEGAMKTFKKNQDRNQVWWGKWLSNLHQAHCTAGAGNNMAISPALFDREFWKQQVEKDGAWNPRTSCRCHFTLVISSNHCHTHKSLCWSHIRQTSVHQVQLELVPAETVPLYACLQTPALVPTQNSNTNPAPKKKEGGNNIPGPSTTLRPTEIFSRILHFRPHQPMDRPSSEQSRKRLPSYYLTDGMTKGFCATQPAPFFACCSQPSTK